jgi:hypothetical protein
MAERMDVERGCPHPQQSPLAAMSTGWTMPWSDRVSGRAIVPGRLYATEPMP